MISHIVLFTPRPDSQEAELRSFATSVAAIASRIPEVAAVMVGKRVSVDAGYDRSMGDMTYDYVAVLEFNSVQDLASYLGNPAHSEMGAMFWRICERTVVIEVEMKPASEWNVAELVRRPRTTS